MTRVEGVRKKRDRVVPFVLVVASGAIILLTGCGESAAPETLGVSVARVSAAPVRLGQKEFERALASRLSRSSAGLPKHPTPLGGGRIDLRDRFQHVSIVHKRPDGTAETVCVTTPGELHAALGRGAQAVSP